MSLRLEDLSWVWAGAVFAAVSAVIAWRWLGSMTAARRVSAIITRVALVAIIAALLAGATLRRESDRLAVIGIVDVSGSVTRFGDFGRNDQGKPMSVMDAARQFLRRAAQDKRPDDLVGVVTFDGQCAAVMAPTTLTGELDGLVPVPMREGTDIANALRLGMGMSPPGVRTRLVLISDGVQTSGDALAAARELGLRAGSDAEPTSDQQTGGGNERRSAWGGVDVLPVEYQVMHEVVVEGLDAPPRISTRARAGASGEGTTGSGRTVTLRALLRSAGAARGSLRVLDQGRLLDINGDAPGVARSISLAPGSHVEIVDVPLSDERVHRFEAVWEPEEAGADPAKGAGSDAIAENNRARAFTIAAGRPSVLVIDGVGGGDERAPAGLLARTLASAGLSVRTIAPEAFSPDLLELQAVDAVLLQSVASDALSAETQQALLTFVRDMGGGLAMIGGPDSFAPGGWKGSVLEPVLPVRLDLPERMVTPAAAVIIVLDMSGSMRRTVMGSMRSQMEIAAEGAAKAIEAMDKTDLVGVVAFSDETEVTVPLGPNGDPKRSAERVRGISPDGGTIIGPALRIAWDQLKAVKAEEKHVIVLTDGKSTDSDILAQMCGKMREDKVRTSTIAVGDDTDTASLSDMASEGGGKFYRVVDPNLLPRIFVKAVRIIRSPMIRRVTFTPVVSASGSPVADEVLQAARGAGPDGGVSRVPALNAVVLTQARPEPGITHAMATPTGEPLLAYWNVGTGKVAAWTSDAHEWCAPWTGWEGYARMWNRLVLQIARPTAERGMDLRAEIVNDQLRVRLEASDASGAPVDGLNVPATVFLPNGERRTVRLEPVGSGQYQASLDAPAGGVYVVSAVPSSGGANTGLAPVIAGVSRTEGIEYRRLSSDRGLLEEVARESGGRVLDWGKPGEAGLFDRAGIRPAQARVPLWRPLLWAALVVMLLDVATRRIAWDRFISREFGDQVRRTVRSAVRDRGGQAEKTLGRLREREPGRELWQARESASDLDKTLGDEAALEIVQRESARRRAARDAVRQVPPAGLDSPIPTRDAGSLTPGPTAPEPKTEGAPEHGLFAAKKRARDRMSGDE